MVRKVDLTYVWVVGGNPMADDVVQSLMAEVDVPSFKEGVHARADEVISDPFLASTVLPVAKFVSDGGVLYLAAL